MRRLRRIALLGALAIMAIAAQGAQSAIAAPVWNLDIHHNETNFPPGGTAQYWFELANVGPDASSGPMTLRIDLPGGITRDAVVNGGPWSCPGSAGESVLICTRTQPVARHLHAFLIVSVNINPGAEGDRFATATISGGGAAKPDSAFELTHISPEPAGFGILPETFVPDFFEADGRTAEREAGAHPALFTTPFDITSISAPIFGEPDQKRPTGNIRDLEVLLPPGFIGAPTASTAESSRSLRATSSTAPKSASSTSPTRAA